MTYNAQRIRELAPAVFAENPAEKVSGKYTFVPTYRVLDALDNQGWQCFQAKQQKSRNPSDAEHTKHTLVFRHPDMPMMHPELGGIIPTIRAINSHNWQSRFELLFGAIIQLCGNGLFVGSVWARYSIRHDSILEDLDNILGRFNSAKTRIVSTFREWSEKMLTDSELMEFGMIAARIRFGEEAATSEHARTLLLARRQENMPNDLWNVFNRVQENAVKGGVKVPGTPRQMRYLQNIGREKGLNEALWEAAEQFAQ